jgi:dephospho-CoA kinase
MKNFMIIGVCGTISAGKETLTSFLREKGLVYFETSAIIKEELVKLGLEITRTNMQDWADELRKKEGVGALMKIMLERAKKDLSKNYMFDSLRNDGEAEFLRKNCNGFILIAVDAPRRIRFERMIARGKEHDPKNWQEFLRVDKRDLCDTSNPLGQQTRKLLGIADFKIINDADLQSSMKKIEDVWAKISGS